nr:MAG TPA: hypothetical protein [Caudoviricetes sp.]
MFFIFKLYYTTKKRESQKFLKIFLRIITYSQKNEMRKLVFC